MNVVFRRYRLAVAAEQEAMADVAEQEAAASRLSDAAKTANSNTAYCRAQELAALARQAAAWARGRATDLPRLGDRRRAAARDAAHAATALAHQLGVGEEALEDVLDLIQ